MLQSNDGIGNRMNGCVNFIRYYKNIVQTLTQTLNTFVTIFISKIDIEIKLVNIFSTKEYHATQTYNNVHAMLLMLN